MKYLSPSSINLYLNCPRCFWLSYSVHASAKVKRPTSPFPSLPNACDGLLKDYFDQCRQTSQTPPEVASLGYSLFSNLELLNEWRGKGVKTIINDAPVLGKLDDLLQNGNELIITDFKTKGCKPEEGYGNKYYGVQLSIYGLLLQELGYKVSSKAVILFYTPVFQNGAIKLECTPHDITLDFERAKEVISNTFKCFNSEEMPEASESCGFCSYVNKRN